MYSATPPPPLVLADPASHPSLTPVQTPPRSAHKPSHDPPAPWKTLDYAFPPFVPGVQLPSVYERAGFDVYRESQSTPPPSGPFHAYPTSPQPPPSAASSSSSSAGSVRSSGHSSSSSSSSYALPPPRLGHMQKRPSLTQLEPISSLASTCSTASSKKVPTLLRFLHKSPSNSALDKASISNPICTSTSTFPITTIRVPADGSGRFSSSSLRQSKQPSQDLDLPTIKLNDLILDESRNLADSNSSYQESPSRLLPPLVDDNNSSSTPPYSNSNKSSASISSSVGSTTPKTIKPADTPGALDPRILSYSPTSVYSPCTKNTPSSSSSPNSQSNRTPPSSQSETDPSSITTSLSSSRLSSASSIYTSATAAAPSSISPPSASRDDYLKLDIGDLAGMADMDKNYESLIAPLSAMNLNLKNLPLAASLPLQDYHGEKNAGPLPLISRSMALPLQNKTNLPLASQGESDTKQHLCFHDNKLSTPVTTPISGSFPINTHTSSSSDNYTPRSSSTTSSSLFSAPLSHGSSESSIDSMLSSPVTLPLTLHQRPPNKPDTEPLPALSIAPPPPSSYSQLLSCPTPTTSSSASGPHAKHSKRGPCRGCGQVITGKSVSSRDGKLSGRWHRACFSCTGCGTRDFSLPLQVLSKLSSVETNTAETEFYILNDLPYCYLCYHTVNDSICSVCSLGIEGRCLDDGHSRYHAACALCSTCSVPLVPQEDVTADDISHADDDCFSSCKTGNTLIFVCNKLLYCAQHACEMEARSNGNAPVEKRRTRQFFM